MKIRLDMIAASTVLILGLLALASAFSWAAFDAAWWAPMDGPHERGAALWLLHGGFTILGIVGALWWLDEADRRW